VAKAAPPADDDEGSEATMAVDLSALVGQIDASTDVPLQRSPLAAAPAPAAEDNNESTVALVLNDMVNFIDSSATLPQSRPDQEAADDLKLIKGIGPVSEARLNEFGVRTYAALAALEDEDIGALADHVKMSVDRVRPWVEQARARLAGEDEDV
jgi:NADH-quinone oxidoreductase subunit E